MDSDIVLDGESIKIEGKISPNTGTLEVTGNLKVTSIENIGNLKTASIENSGTISTSVLNVNEVSPKNNQLKIRGSYLYLDSFSRRPGTKETEDRRALVHDDNDKLTINYNADYKGGVQILGPTVIDRLYASEIFGRLGSKNGKNLSIYTRGPDYPQFDALVCEGMPFTVHGGNGKYMEGNGIALSHEPKNDKLIINKDGYFKGNVEIQGGLELTGNSAKPGALKIGNFAIVPCEFGDGNKQKGLRISDGFAYMPSSTPHISSIILTSKKILIEMVSSEVSFSGGRKNIYSYFDLWDEIGKLKKSIEDLKANIKVLETKLK